MALRAHDLRYPLLCLTRQMDFCIVRSALELERCNPAVFWREHFYDNLRLVEANGETYEIARATIRSPSSLLGQWIARFLDLPISVEIEAQRTVASSLGEIKRIVEQAVDEETELFEELSGKSLNWWKQSLGESESIVDLIRMLQVARENA
jgi:hypothetical protein